MALLAFAAACACPTNIAGAAEPDCARPVAVADGWNATDPATAGFDSAALCVALDASKDAIENPTNTHAVLVERRGRLVAERYFMGHDKPLGNWFQRSRTFGPNDLHDVRSISKSVVGLLVGIAQQQGKIGALSTPVKDFFPEHAELLTPEHRTITLTHLLTMTPGLEWDESGSAFRLGNNETRMSLARDPARYVLTRPMREAPGTRWVYNGGTTTLLAGVLERATGTPFEHYAREMLFTPLGINEFEWRAEFHDKPSPYSGLRLRPRDLAKIGRLLLNDGRWGERQLIPAEWVRASLAAQVPIGDGLDYGYQWWTGTLQHGDKPLRWSAGFGNGGQRLFLVPALDLVVVITAGRYGEANNGRASMELFRRIVGAVR